MAKEVFFDNNCICYSDSDCTTNNTCISSEGINTPNIQVNCLCATHFNSVNAEVVCTKQQYVYLRSGSAVELAANETSGIIVNNGSSNTSKSQTFMGVDCSGLAKIGKGLNTTFDLQTIATRSENPSDKGIAIWNADCKCFETLAPTNYSCTDDYVLISKSIYDNETYLSQCPAWCKLSEVAAATVIFDGSTDSETSCFTCTASYSGANGCINIDDFSCITTTKVNLVVNRINADTTTTSCCINTIDRTKGTITLPLCDYAVSNIYLKTDSGCDNYIVSNGLVTLPIGSCIDNCINNLNYSGISINTNQTVTCIYECNGKINATCSAISITCDQISDVNCIVSDAISESKIYQDNALEYMNCAKSYAETAATTFDNCYGSHNIMCATLDGSTLYIYLK